MFIDQHRKKSTISSRAPCGIRNAGRIPQDFSLARWVLPAVRPGPRPSLEVVTELLDPFLFGLVAGALLGQEGRSAVSEALFLPAIEDRR
jgi:hypothetical protein